MSDINGSDPKAPGQHLLTAAISFLVTNRLFAAVFFAAILMLGWIKLPDLKISQYPDIDIPMLTVNLTLPGASAPAMEDQVVDRIEEALESVRRVRDVSSRITNSFAQVAIEFERGVDIDAEYTDVYARLNNLRGDLPPGVEMVVLKQNPMDRVVSFIIAVTGDGTGHAERLAAAERLKRGLRDVDGLENIAIMQPDEEVRVTLDQGRMVHLGVEVDEVARAIRQNNQFLPTGTFTLGDKAIATMASSDGYTSTDQIAATRVISRHGTAVTIGDIAEDDGKHKNADHVIEMLGAAKEQNCNLLLNTGPLPDGSIHPEDVATLREVGRRGKEWKP